MREQRAAKHIRTDPPGFLHSISRKRNDEDGAPQLPEHNPRFQKRQRTSRPPGLRVGANAAIASTALNLPIRKRASHKLKALRYPFDPREDHVLVIGHGRRPCEMHVDFGLDLKPVARRSICAWSPGLRLCADRRIG